MADPFTLGDPPDDHTVGARDCPACWLPPDPHDCGTPGCLEHTSWGDYYGGDGGYWLYRQGDRCRT